MLKRLNISIVLILISWIVSSAQPSSPDTVRCYGITELRQIAVKLVQGQQCDTLLRVSEAQLINRDSTINILNEEISGYAQESALKESIIIAKKDELKAVNLQLKKTERKLLWTKVGWLSSSGILAATSIFLLFR